MALNVIIYVNGRPIIIEHAQCMDIDEYNIGIYKRTTQDDNGFHEKEPDIIHRRDDGAVLLAIKLLELRLAEDSK